MFKVMIDHTDASYVNLEEMYQDKLPPEFKKLEEIDDDNLDEKDQNFDIEKCKAKTFKHKAQIEDMLPEEGRNIKKIL